MTKFQCVTHIFGNVERSPLMTMGEANACLSEFARGAGLSVHWHLGSWEGNAVSTAYEVGGDPFFHARAYVCAVREEDDATT